MQKLNTGRYELIAPIVEKQMDLIWTFTQSLAYYRAVSQDYVRITRNKEYWTFSMNSYYLRAVVDWCSIFGANHNESHWKKVADRDDQSLDEEVRQLILKAGNFSKVTWEDYHKKITDFRNDYAAHRNIVYLSDSVPKLDSAFSIAKSYFEWLKTELSPSKNAPITLDEAFPNFQIEVINILKNDLK